MLSLEERKMAIGTNFFQMIYFCSWWYVHVLVLMLVFNVVFIQVWMLLTFGTWYIGGLQGHGDDKLDYQHMSCCFNLKNSIVHFDILEVLEFFVALCSKNVKVFLWFQFDLVDQCVVIEHFNDFKRLLLQSFK